MGVSFANPAALWGLVGVPVVLALHFLQSRVHRVEIATLFLLERLPEETRRGVVFTRLRRGAQLWLQLAAVLLLCLLLGRPMWVRRDSVQTVVVVLDASWSMQAFREGVETRVEPLLRGLEGTVGQTEWVLMSSDLSRPVLYQGGDLEVVLGALAEFQPDSPGHDMRPALSRGREVAGSGGVVLFVTDHPPEKAVAGAVVVGVGEPKGNLALGGVRFEEEEGGGVGWSVSLLHFGEGEKEVRMRMKLDDGREETRQLRVPPAAMMPVRGLLPEGARRGRFEMEGDGLEVDNVLPFVVPRVKPLVWNASEGLETLARRVMATVQGSEQAAGEGVVWREYDGGMPEASGNGVFFPKPGPMGPYAPPLAEDHVLTRDLAWTGVLARPRDFAALRPGDQPLVWMGELPLVLLRESGGVRQLIFTCALSGGNLERLPAFVLLLHRFLEGLRAEIDLPEARMLEAGGELAVAGPGLRYRFEDLQGRVSSGPDVPRRVPDEPGYLQLWRGMELRLDAAVVRGDLSESDVRGASRKDAPEGLTAEIRERNSERDVLAGLWVLLLAGCVVGSWMAGGGGLTIRG